MILLGRSQLSNPSDLPCSHYLQCNNDLSCICLNYICQVIPTSVSSWHGARRYIKCCHLFRHPSTRRFHWHAIDYHTHCFLSTCALSVILFEWTYKSLYIVFTFKLLGYSILIMWWGCILFCKECLKYSPHWPLPFQHKGKDCSR